MSGRNSRDKGTPAASSRARFTLLHAIHADRELSASAKCVATQLLLTFRNNKTGRCNPSFAAIAEAVGRDRRSIIPAVAELKARGWVKVASTKGGSSANTNKFIFDLTAKQPVKCTTPLTSEEDDKQSSRFRTLSTHPAVAELPTEEPGADGKPQLLLPLAVKHTTPVTSEEHDTPTGETDFTSEVKCTRGDVDFPRTIEEPLSPSERECVYVLPPARAFGALEVKFERLCHIWRKPDGIDRKKAFAAFKTVCDEHDSDDMIASADRWVAVTQPRYLPKLENWLRNGAWLNEPQPRKASGGRGVKSNPVHEMLSAGGFEGYGHE